MDQMRNEFRGIGSVRSRTPIGAYLQIGWRKKRADGLWEYAGAFGGSEKKGMVRCFNIMSPVPDSKGGHTGNEPRRSPHSNFVGFNSADPSKCKEIRAVLVNSSQTGAYRNKLGAFRAPSGQKSPPRGWWCQGDGKRASRWDGAAFKDIPCPSELCPYQVDGSGPKGNGRWCKCNLSLIAQFRWGWMRNRDGGPIRWPEVVFQWDSKGWNNAGYIQGLFDEIDEVAAVLEYEKGTFPVIGLPITMRLSEKHEVERQYPVVNFSIEGSPFDWVRMMHQLQVAKNPAAVLAGPEQEPLSLEHDPPAGATEEQIDLAREAGLVPGQNYKPANARVVK